MPKPKIAMIGAGSVVFRLNLLGDIFSLFTHLCDSHSRHTDM
jgi:alpha-galactosidase/6-phospho-beta-glucosidase family protein